MLRKCLLINLILFENFKQLEIFTNIYSSCWIEAVIPQVWAHGPSWLKCRSLGPTPDLLSQNWE